MPSRLEKTTTLPTIHLNSTRFAPDTVAVRNGDILVFHLDEGTSATLTDDRGVWGDAHAPVGISAASDFRAQITAPDPVFPAVNTFTITATGFGGFGAIQLTITMGGKHEDRHLPRHS